MSGGTNEWNEDLFGCFNDCGTCCYGFWCTSCLFGSNAEKIDDSNCISMCCAYSCLSYCALCWLPQYFKRKALREKYGIREDPACGDFPATLFCTSCALCQETREMKSRENNGGVANNGHSAPAVLAQPRAGPQVPLSGTRRV